MGTASPIPDKGHFTLGGWAHLLDTICAPLPDSDARRVLCEVRDDMNTCPQITTLKCSGWRDTIVHQWPQLPEVTVTRLRLLCEDIGVQQMTMIAAAS